MIYSSDALKKAIFYNALINDIGKMFLPLQWCKETMHDFKASVQVCKVPTSA